MKEKLFAPYRPVPSYAKKSARALTAEEARDLVLHYIANGLIELDQTVTFNKNNKPAWPRPKDRAKVVTDIGGVSFVRAGVGKQRATGPLQMNLIVLLCRMATTLKREWGTNEIGYNGLGIARNDPTDRHGIGRAMDLLYARIRGGKKIDVLKDWGNKPFKPKKGEKHPPAYRLAENDDDACRFFRSVYEFLTREATDNQLNVPSKIGGRSSILTPDHPGTNTRAGHQNHIHFDVPEL